MKIKPVARYFFSKFEETLVIAILSHIIYVRINEICKINLIDLRILIIVIFMLHWKKNY